MGDLKRAVLVAVAASVLMLAAAAPGLAAFPVVGKGAIEGYVWLPDGRPAAGAKVYCKLIGLRWSREWAPELSLETTADAQGAYRFEVFDEGKYIVRAELLDYAPALGEMIDPNRPFDLFLEKGQMLRGRVTSSLTGEPIARAKVFLFHKFHELGPVETNANGEYRFRQLPLMEFDELFVQGIPIGWVNQVVEHVKVTDEGAAEVDVPLDRGCTITGRVFRPDTSEPAANVKVRVFSARHANEIVRTDARGMYRLEAVPPGVVSAEVLDERVIVIDLLKARVWMDTGVTRVLDLPVTPLVRVSGVVKNARGEPVSGAKVDFTGDYFSDFENLGANPPPAPMRGLLRLHRSSIHSGPDGTFTAHTVSAGKWQAVAWAPDHLIGKSDKFTATVRNPADNVLVVLPDGFTLQGTIADEQGKPIPQAKLEVRQGRIPENYIEGLLAQDLVGYADDQGRYLIKGLRPAEGIALRALARGFQVCPAKLAKGAAGDVLTQDFALTAEPTLSGRVVDSAGKPIRRVAIEIIGGQTPEVADSLVVMTDADGRFSTPAAGLPAYTLVATHPYYHDERVTGIEGAKQIDLTLYRYGSIEGEFINYPPEYTRSILVRASTPDNKHVYHTNFPGRAGPFKVPKLYPGTYGLYATDHESKYEAKIPEVVVKEGGKTTGLKLYFKLRIE